MIIIFDILPSQPVEFGQNLNGLPLLGGATQ
jgi:hypothetical protein